ncbi:MAG: hypothetical protein LBH87_03005, partial [Coriobacteriales bacterium]|nr:hypothetical protein [Coriobacteriales bacterium]
HHLFTETYHHRPAYRSLSKLSEYFPHAQILACTATAPDQAGEHISAELGLDSLVIDETRRPNLRLVDRRGETGKAAALMPLVAALETCLIYVNSREAARLLCRQLRKACPDDAESIGFYHAGLEDQERMRIEAEYPNGSLRLLFATSAFGEGVNLPNLRHVVFWDTPLSPTAFVQMAGRAGRDGQEAWVHLLFGAADIQASRRLVSSRAPKRSDLEFLYRYLRAVQRSQGSIALSDDALVAGIKLADPESELDIRQLQAALIIFAELALIAVSYEDTSRVIELPANSDKVDLEDSSYYLEALGELEAFDNFVEWALSQEPTLLEDFIQRPLLPLRTLQRGRVFGQEQ